MDKLDDFLTPARRHRLYALAIAIGVILVGHGVVSAKDLADWLTVIGIALGTVAAPAVAKRNVGK